MQADNTSYIIHHTTRTMITENKDECKRDIFGRKKRENWQVSRICLKWPAEWWLCGPR